MQFFHLASSHLQGDFILLQCTSSLEEEEIFQKKLSLLHAFEQICLFVFPILSASP